MKQKQNFIPKTFQRKIIFYNLLIVIAIASAISYYNFHSYKQDVIANETRNSQNTMHLLSSRLELAYREMLNLLLNCSERQSQFFSGSSISSSANMELSASKVLKDYCAISGYSEYIYRISLYKKDQYFLQAGSYPGSYQDYERIVSSPWFEEKLTQDKYQYYIKLEENPFPLGETAVPFLIPLVRPIGYRPSQAMTDGWVFLAISPKLYSDTLKSMESGHYVYAAAPDGTLLASLTDSSFSVGEFIPLIQDASGPSGTFPISLGHEKGILTYEKDAVSGLMLFEILPYSEIPIDRQVILKTIAMIFFYCIAIGLVLSFLISRQLGRPIKRLVAHLNLVAQGHFSPDPSIESRDEIGTIGHQINQMSSQISALMETRIQGEKEKKDLEIKMLQAQINPHFLYNTLDSIRWIATMQKNSGIVQMVTSLSALLRNMAKGFNEKVTLQQELDFLNDYVIIEKVRYLELFDLQIEVTDPNLYRAEIIKLTLQPLVENAIFNGIEPSGRTGLIKIRAWSEESVLYVSVTDNGIGMPKEQCQKILTDTSRITKSTMSGIGLPNVDRRFKLVYGEDYGLTIESEPDSYTRITISLPLEIRQP
ncbi:MAG: sensor histidine kinase [Lachnospiraceae bacterium]